MSESERKRLTKRTKLIFTYLICLTYVAFGLGYSLWGPTFLDSVRLINSTIDEASNGVVARQFFYGLSAAIFGYIFKHLDRRVGLIYALLGCASAMFMLPFCTTYTQFLAANIIFAVSGGATELGLCAWILEMWKRDSNIYMQSIGFSFAFGSVFAPLLSEPFLSRPLVMNITNGNESMDSSIGEPITKYTESEIGIPYVISGLFFLAIAILHISAKICMRYKSKKKLGVEVQVDDNGYELTDYSHHHHGSKKSRKAKQRMQYLLIIPVATLLLGFEGSIEQSSFSYVHTFAEKVELKLSPSRAAYLNTILNASFTLSRFLGIFLAKKLQTGTMIALDISIILIGTILVLIFSHTYEPGLWVSVAILGFGFSSCWPSIIAYVEDQIRVTDTIAGIFIFGTAVVSATSALVIGQSIEQWPMVFGIFNLVSAVGCGILFTALKLIKVYTKQQTS